jgi:hypothetical protein
VQNPKIVVEPLALAGIDRDHVFELPKILYGELEPLRVRDRPHDVRSNRSTKVDMKVAQRY